MSQHFVAKTLREATLDTANPTQNELLEAVHSMIADKMSAVPA